MKIVDNMPIIIMITAIFINIAIGVNNGIGFSALMIRSMIVTIVFGIFGYMITETVKSVIQYSSLSKHPDDLGEKTAKPEGNLSDSENKSYLDIKVPPLDDEEFISMHNDNDDGFVAVNPVYMGDYDNDKQD